MQFLALATLITLGHAASVSLTYFTNPNCSGSGTGITLQQSKCNTPGGNGYDVQSYIITDLSGTLSTSKVQGYKDGSACIGSTAFSVHPNSITRGQCQHVAGAAGSMELQL